MLDIEFQSDAFDEFTGWLQADKKTFNRLVRIIKETRRTPFQGIGKPEPLKHGLSGYWSRRITHGDRFVYKVEESRIIVIACKGHYKA